MGWSGGGVVRNQGWFLAGFPQKITTEAPRGSRRWEWSRAYSRISRRWPSTSPGQRTSSARICSASASLRMADRRGALHPPSIALIMFGETPTRKITCRASRPLGSTSASTAPVPCLPHTFEELGKGFLVPPSVPDFRDQGQGSGNETCEKQPCALQA